MAARLPRRLVWPVARACLTELCLRGALGGGGEEWVPSTRPLSAVKKTVSDEEGFLKREDEGGKEKGRCGEASSSLPDR